MSELISGKEALIALANGKEVEYQAMDKNFYPLQDFLDSAKIRIKPKTILIGNIEVPAPFEPKEGDTVWFISDDHTEGYTMIHEYKLLEGFKLGAWRTEDEIKQVVSELRSIFKGE